MTASGISLATASCASLKTPRIDDKFIGYWRDQNAQFQNWWEIAPAHVTNYSAALDDGRCVGREATILASDRIAVDFGSRGTFTMKLDRGRLLFVSDHGTAMHIRVGPSTICSYDNAHFEGAPYP